MSRPLASLAASAQRYKDRVAQAIIERYPGFSDIARTSQV
ncbi:hypothetical protein I8G32_02866 [Rhodopseudomonas palustris]|nr:hypothetical protein I8G32_02866 [Rhodopseudomonas palustris]